jgi:protein O-GlcNAc transferase
MGMIADLFAAALEHHRAGRLNAAEQLYRQILQADAQQPDVWHLRGSVAHQASRSQEAIEYISQALLLNGNQAAYHHSLGDAYRSLGRLAEAIACYQRAVQLQPGLMETHNNLGLVFQELGQTQPSVACFLRALELQPHDAEIHNNLGRARQDEGNLQEAISCFRQALAINPTYAEAYVNLGNALKYQGCTDESVTFYQQALQLKPDYAEAHNSLGTALQQQGRLDEAIACFQRSLHLQPDNAEVHYNLAVALQNQKRLDEAAASYQRALELRPEFLGALGQRVLLLQHLCLWDDLRSQSERLIEFVAKRTASDSTGALAPFIFLTLTTPPTTAEQQWQCGRQWVEYYLKSAMVWGQQLNFARPRSAPKKIVLGYLSADYRMHPVAQLIVQILEQHDRDHFTVFGYSYGPHHPSPMRERMVKAVDHFVDLKDASFLEAAQRIAADQVDILVDLTGYTQFARTQILALRPAPIQVNYLGYTATMAAPFIDYILVDDFIVPAEQQPFFTEKLVHLPGCYQVSDSQRPNLPDTPTRAASGLPEEGFVFCCFNNNYKISTDMFSVWMNLLQAKPGSVLWLLASNEFAPQNLCREAEKRGVAPARLVFAPRVPLAEHLARHRLANLFLDTFPFNAHVTAGDALFAGCPVLTLAGQTFVSRVAGSLLRAIGLPELITTSLDDYHAMALRLAREPELLADLRARLALNRPTSRLFDAGIMVGNLERAYRTMWEGHLSGAPPRTFVVSPT